MNTAGRLLSLSQQLISNRRSSNGAMIHAWTKAFDLSPESVQLEEEVTACLLAVRSELELLRVKLLKLGLDQPEVHAGLGSLRHISSPTALHQGLGLLNDLAQPHHQLTFIWANWAFREESEDEMPADELAALRSELDSMESSLQDTEMTHYLRDFIQRQIGVIRAALRVYRVQGVKPIETALHQVAGAYKVEEARVQAEYKKASEPAKSLVVRMSTTIKKVAEVADSLDKIKKAGESAYTLAASVAPMVLPYIQNLLK